MESLQLSKYFRVFRAFRGQISILK
jgi:hypothetical protein